MKKIYIAAVLMAAALVLAVSCKKAEAPDDDRLVVAVSIVPEKAFVDAVAGDLVQVVTVIPPGSSPETYEMTPMQRIQLEKASLYFAIGVPAESSGILKSLAANTEVVHLDDAVDAVVPPLYLGEAKDPHRWLSPSRAAIMVQEIAARLSALDSDNARVYADNANAYCARIMEAKERISSILAGRKGEGFIVFHPAFAYFADEFGLVMHALEEEGKEASPEHLARMVDLARNQGSKAIFYQAEVDSRQSKAFAEEIGGRSVMLEPLAYDYIGNLEKMADVFREVL